jgi:hypothetical protein
MSEFPACDATYVHGLLVGGVIGFVACLAVSLLVVAWFSAKCAPDPDDAAARARLTPLEESQ